MNDDPHICVICGDSINPEKDSIVVEVLPSDHHPFPECTNPKVFL